MGHSTTREPTPEHDRARLAGQLRERLPRLEQDVLAYFAEQASTDVGVAHLLHSLPIVIAAALDGWVSAIEEGHDWHIPTQMLRSHARRAAVNGVAMPSSLRRSSHVAALVLEALSEVLHLGSYSAGTQRYAMTTTNSVANALTAAVAEGHAQELRSGIQTKAERVSELVRRLLNGEDVDARELGYDLTVEHICVVATGNKILKTTEVTAERLGFAVLVAPQDDETVWAWFGGKAPLPVSDVARSYLASATDAIIAISEPAAGVDGFRAVHQQAHTAFSAGLCNSQQVTLFADVVDIAPFLQDPRAAQVLIKTYLVPLYDRRGRSNLIATLDAYFRCDCNASSAAASLKVHRRTIENRIGAAEKRMGGRPLRAWRRQVELAIHLESMQATGHRALADSVVTFAALGIRTDSVGH